jgi:light-regulated signal transduction histidine kinase (bacteriophytochrome)
LEETNKELEAFSYSVSHDLRAPLRAINGFSKILVDEHRESLPPSARLQLDRICESAKLMGQLVDDLLNLSRLGRQPLRKSTVNTDEMVRQIVDELSGGHEGRRMAVMIEKLPEVKADANLLRQVYQNLLSNAFKYTRNRKDPLIEVGSHGKDNSTVFYVRDNGAGFDMKYSNKLFGVFQRLHRTEEFEGTGVGLAIVQRIVHRHGGRVWAEAEIDKGATFSFELPTSSG